MVKNWKTTAALEPWHVLAADVVRERFDYDDAPGIQVACVRAYRLSRTWTFPELPAYGGCRSWVKLPELPSDIVLHSVLSDEEHARRLEALTRLLRSTR